MQGNYLIRAGKSPFMRASPLETLTQNLTLTNTGNLLFQHAFVRSIYDPAIKITSIQDRRFSEKEIQVINSEYDALYLTFANAFRPSFRAALKEWTATIKKLRIPVVIVGVGAQCESDDPARELAEINDDVASLCRAVLEKSSTIGVRGNFTANYLNDLGIKRVDVIGCPSMFYFGSQLPKPKLPDLSDPDLIAFHFSPQSPAQFNARNERVDAHFARIMDFILSRSNTGLTYIAQDTQELSSRIWGTQGVTLAQYAPEFAKVATIYPIDPHVWIKDLQSFDLAIGTRIHGSIAAVLAGIPSFILCHDSRTAELADWFGLPRADQAIDNAEKLTPESLGATFRSSKMLEIFPDRFERYRSFLAKNKVPLRFDEGGVNPGWQEYERKIELAGLPKTLDSHTDDLALLNEKINQIYKMTRKVMSDHRQNV